MVAIVRVGSFDHQDAIGRNSFRFSGRIGPDRKSTRLNSSHLVISYAVFCLKKKKTLRTALCCFPVSSRHCSPLPACSPVLYTWSFLSPALPLPSHAASSSLPCL